MESLKPVSEDPVLKLGGNLGEIVAHFSPFSTEGEVFM